MYTLRASGLLLHPTSLPGSHGIGDMGEEAYRFVDFLVAGRQRLWQVLPLGPTGYGDSPYAAVSAFAGNPMLISLDRMVSDGLLPAADVAALPPLPVGRIDFEAVRRAKLPLYRRAFARFSRSPADLRAQYGEFEAAKSDWLPDFALFTALREARDRASWHEWEQPLARREAAALALARAALTDEIAFHSFLQFLFFRQWRALCDYARRRGVRIVGDMPIFVADDSVDVWSNPGLFQLAPDGKPSAIAGVPPDYFSASGQRWGNPLYNWPAIAATGYRWWVDRVRGALEQVDILRMDHFRGFEAYWEVPAWEETAVNGRWVAGPGAALFDALAEELGMLPFIAEDLGLITPEVDALREAFHFPGMAILQFAFDGPPTNAYLPHNLTRDCVVYTGTHDNETTLGWFEGKSDGAKRRIRRYLGCDQDVVWHLIRTALNTVAETAMVPVQDLLELGNEARMNTPGRVGGNWAWRYEPGQLRDELAERLAELTELSGRGIRRGPPSRVTYTSPGDLD